MYKCLEECPKYYNDDNICVDRCTQYTDSSDTKKWIKLRGNNVPYLYETRQWIAKTMTDCNTDTHEYFYDSENPNICNETCPSDYYVVVSGKTKICQKLSCPSSGGTGNKYIIEGTKISNHHVHHLL